MESSSSSTQEFASLVAVTSKHSDETSTLRYLAVRILPVEFRADLSSLNTLAAATIGPIRKTTGIPVGTQLERCLSPGTHDARPPTYDEARSLALRRRGYIEALVLHPMEATLSFEPTRAAVFEEDDNDEEVLGSIQNLATISKATVRLKSFAVTNVMESPEELSRRIWRHYGYQILSQWHRIVGSLASIGSPINLVEDIGSGVREFFYAPSRGIVKSPQAFTTGLYTGTASLGAGVVGGLSSSIAGVGGVLSHNVSMLTGDSEFIASREARRRRFAADGGGASAGIVEGVETVATGLMQGVGGLLTKPVQGARSEGLAGLAAGTAQGVTGLAVKPVVGILDGASAVLLGISQTVVPARIKQIRPARALDRAKGSTVSVIPGCPVAAAATAASNPD
ncbi:hypothetical protein CTAYLR_005342 [Chrysophaeum taylorii]|uniref:Vacuolar protein sorting-associated protein 13 DH-like domain-containing protein n=1 Tax=Chrysophaeum taylorii TaxID=2483200 RepID=A0AAD7XKC0_9STRA|nr:hypothetical protein CTAYLR_005342 [Chrysophaeum taylorii]